jgi:hypothetical protein
MMDLDAVPHQLLLVGGSYVGLEFGQIRMRIPRLADSAISERPKAGDGRYWMVPFLH